MDGGDIKKKNKKQDGKCRPNYVNNNVIATGLTIKF